MVACKAPANGCIWTLRTGGTVQAHCHHVHAPPGLTQHALWGTPTVDDTPMCCWTADYQKFSWKASDMLHNEFSGHMMFQPGLAPESCPPKVYTGFVAGSLALRPTVIRRVRVDLRCKSPLQHPHAEAQHVDVAVIGAGKFYCAAT